MRRRSAASPIPPHLAVYAEADWTGAPPTAEERNIFGATAATARGMAAVARSRWLWARWEWAEAAGLPDAVDFFVEWLQGPPGAPGVAV